MFEGNVSSRKDSQIMPRILVVEDEDGVRDALVLRLEGWGAQATSCAGLSAVRALTPAAGTVDILLTDLRLPDGDGLAVIDATRAQLGAHVPALVVTGSTLPSELARLARAGVPVLNKPFRAEALLAALQAALATTRAPA